MSSEEAWGAAAHALKAVARRRGWPAFTHDALMTIAFHIAERSGVPDARTLFGHLSSTLHRNFYNDTRTPEEIEALRRDAREFLRVLREADKALPDDLEPPTNPGYRSQAFSILSVDGRSALPAPAARASRSGASAGNALPYALSGFGGRGI